MKGERKVLVMAASLVLLLVVLGALFGPNPLVVVGSSTCYCGGRVFEDPTNNPYTCGECTWYASYKRQDIPDDQDWGDARDWDTSARDAGFPVGSQPRHEAIMVLEGGAHGADPAGHVAYVENVGESNFTISEMSWDCNGDGIRDCYCERTIPLSQVSEGMSFIYKTAGTHLLLQLLPTEVWPPSPIYATDQLQFGLDIKNYGEVGACPEFHFLFTSPFGLQIC